MSKDLTKNGFATYEPLALCAKARHVVTQMSAYKVFENPNPAFPVFITGADELEVAEADASTGDEIKVAIRNDKFTTLVGIMQQGGTYVNNIANGDRTIALQSGYEIRKENEPRVMQEIATAPKAKRLPTAGKVQCRVQSQKAATKSTNWYITDDALKPVSGWTKVENKKSTFIFENLVPGKEYTICAELQGARGQSEMSPRATVIA